MLKTVPASEMSAVIKTLFSWSFRSGDGRGRIKKSNSSSSKSRVAVCAKRKLRVEKGGQRAKRVGASSCRWSEKSSLVGSNICAGVLNAVRN